MPLFKKFFHSNASVWNENHAPPRSNAPAWNEKGIYVLLLLTFFISVLLWDMAIAQSPQDLNQQLRVAQQYERLKQYDRALSIYRALEKTFPNVPAIFDGIVRNMLQLKQYDGAVTLCQEKLKSEPKNSQYLRWLGESLIKAGQREEGIAQWEKIITLNPKDDSAYLTVANLYFSNGMLSEAADVYQRARKARNEPTIFARELARIYEVEMNFRQAVQEYILYMHAMPTQRNWVEGRIKKLAEEEGIWQLALEVTQASVEQFPDDPNIRKVLGDLYLVSGQPGKGLAEFILYEQNSDSKGRALVDFGRHCMDESEYETAQQAFEYVLTNDPNSPYKALSQSLMAETLTHQNKYEEAIDMYQQIINTRSRSNEAADAYFHMGNIYLDKLDQPDNAIQTYQEFLKKFSRGVLRIDVQFRIGDAYLIKGDLTKAKSQYENIMKATRAEEIVERATYKIGYLTFLQGDMEKAGEILTTMIESYPNGVYLNDALRLQFFLTENKDMGDEELREYMRGLLLSEQNQYDEAINVFQNTNPPLADDAMFQIGLQYEKKGDHDAAIDAYRDLTKKHPDSYLCPEAMDRVAMIYMDIYNDYQQAKTELENILFNYPESLYADLARSKLLKVKGKLQ